MAEIKTADEKLSAWVLKQLLVDREGWVMHSEEYGCEYTASNVRFGIAHTGVCETCYYEYPSIIFDLTCSCPTKVPQKKDPTKMRANPNRVRYTEMDLGNIEYLGGLAAIYAEMEAL